MSDAATNGTIEQGKARVSLSMREVNESQVGVPELMHEVE